MKVIKVYIGRMVRVVRLMKASCIHKLLDQMDMDDPRDSGPC
jgi:hypothetical protein